LRRRTMLLDKKTGYHLPHPHHPCRVCRVHARHPFRPPYSPSGADYTIWRFINISARGSRAQVGAPSLTSNM
jgi:hypothetical protein